MATVKAADTTVTRIIDGVAKLWQREYTFNVSPGVTHICFVQTGTTNSPQNTFHVGERTYYSTT